MQVWSDTELRQYIVDQAKRHSRRRAVQEELVQEAWLCISCAPGDYTPGSYKSIAYKAIYSSYWRDKKETFFTRRSGSIEEIEDYDE